MEISKSGSKGSEIEDLYDENDDDIQENKYLTFYIDRECYALKLLHIVEIIRLLNITPVPDMDDFVKGIINLRGKIIPVMDVRLRFNLPEISYNDRTCIIIGKIDDIEMGFLVDRVSDVVEISQDQIEDTPRVNNDGRQMFVLGIGKIGDEIKIILDINRLLFEEEIEKIKKAG